MVLRSAFLLAVLACGGENPARTAIEAQKAAEAAPVAEGAWTCPMHPEVAEEGPGSCPKCGMPLVEGGK